MSHLSEPKLPTEQTIRNIIAYIYATYQTAGYVVTLPHHGDKQSKHDNQATHLAITRLLTQNLPVDASLESEALSRKELLKLNYEALAFKFYIYSSLQHYASIRTIDKLLAEVEEGRLYLPYLRKLQEQPKPTPAKPKIAETLSERLARLRKNAKNAKT